MSKYTYLLIDLLTIAGPLLLSFDRKVAFFKNWKYILPAILIPSFLYLIWDFMFTRLGVWSFNKHYILGIYIVNLPFEEILFFIAIPYACLFIYECLRVYFPNWNFRAAAHIFGWILVLLCIVAIAYQPDHIYTSVTAILLLITLLNHLLVTRGDYLAHAFITWIFAMVPMAIVNGFLTSMPVVLYNLDQKSGILTGSIPIEDYFYNLLLLIWMVWVYERYKQRHLHRPVEKSAK